MLKRVFTILFLGVFGLSHAQLNVYLDYGVFQTPDQNPYIETYLVIIGSSLKYEMTAAGGWEGGVEVTMVINAGDSTSYADRYLLRSPEVSTDEDIPNFVDIQRIPLKSQDYQFDLRIKDPNSDGEPLRANIRLPLSELREKVWISHIELIESYEKTTSMNVLSKSGYDILPYVPAGRFLFGEDIEELKFYTEINNTSIQLGPDSAYAYMYFLETDKGYQISQYTRFEKRMSSLVEPVLSGFNIENLPTGNYNLAMKVINTQGEVLAEKKIPFERYNPSANLDLEEVQDLIVSSTFVDEYTEMDSLIRDIECLYPIATINERGFSDKVVRSGDIDLMKRYFYGFWVNRDAFEPEKAWKNYEEQVQLVNRLYSTRIMKGWETDRGRVYLMYGAPSDLEVRPNEPASYPYEIWQYYNIPTLNQRNVMFVFANRDLSSNEYMMIHSSAQGEIYNPRWQTDLMKRNNQAPNLDDNTANDHFGTRIGNNNTISIFNQ
jgi:GWxTD domain-containing protein